ncbi:hypothetical protein LTR15_009697 [Elasticomyces elasticus]|nr:hypothetical protein LTR15_009697 [Elasticomyces elasticus]
MSASTREAIVATIQRYTRVAEIVTPLGIDSSRGDLAAIIQRYSEVADAVNRREMKRFIAEIRDNWEVLGPTDWHETWGEGYTFEGALALCVYALAFTDHNPDRQGRQLCEAEQMNQVLLDPPLDAFANEIPTPLADPPPRGQMEEKFNSLRAQLQAQYNDSPASNRDEIHLPKDFRELMMMTNGIHGAGVPAETAYTVLVYPVNEHYAGPQSLRYISRRVESEGFVPLAGWEIGACQQHRQKHYVFCRDKGDTTSDNGPWRIFDKAGVDCDVYANLADFLEHETAYVHEEPGGGQTEQVLYHDTYPAF